MKMFLLGLAVIPAICVVYVAISATCKILYATIRDTVGFIQARPNSYWYVPHVILYNFMGQMGAWWRGHTMTTEWYRKDSK